MRIVYLLIFVTIISCAHDRKSSEELIPALSVESTDTSLHFTNGYWFKSGLPFSGNIVHRYEDGKINERTGYYNGKEEGWSYAFFDNSLVSEKRYYHLGEKDSVHSGWWQNGKPRFVYHFKTGVYNGYFTEWYGSGAIYKEIYYVDGKEDRAKGWRENGKVYMNFIVKEGRRYGLENSNLCFTVRQDSLTKE